MITVCNYHNAFFMQVHTGSVIFQMPYIITDEVEVPGITAIIDTVVF